MGRQDTPTYAAYQDEELESGLPLSVRSEQRVMQACSAQPSGTDAPPPWICQCQAAAACDAMLRSPWLASSNGASEFERSVRMLPEPLRALGGCCAGGDGGA